MRRTKISIVVLTFEDMAKGLSKKTGPYLDVSAEHWANGYIYATSLKGYIKGNADGYFQPDMGITHAEVITALLRTIGYNYFAISEMIIC